MPAEFIVSALVTLLVVVDPVGLVPTFLAVTEGMAAAQRRQVALWAALIATAILTGSALGGEWLLRKLSISLPAFRIAGGLLLFSIASEMVFGVRIARQSQTAEKAVKEHARNIAAFPLAIPLMAGPGAITATVLLAGRADGNPAMLASLIGVIALVGLICLAAFVSAGRIGKLIGGTGNIVLSRLLGVLLAAMAVQFVLDGIRAVFMQS
jgi:multiple antibiotic resistance protein